MPPWPADGSTPSGSGTCSPAPADPLVFAVDVTTWPRCDAECSPERGYYYHPSRHSAGQPIIAGWAFQWIAQLSFDRDSWTAPVDAARLQPLDDTNHQAAVQVRAPASGLARHPSAATCLVGKLRMQRGRRACDAGLRIRCRSGLRCGLGVVAYCGHASRCWLCPACCSRRDRHGCGAQRWTCFLGGCRDDARGGSQRCAFRRAGTTSDRAPR
jgi:hypothetical protein